jgi:hypothetical protein
MATQIFLTLLFLGSLIPADAAVPKKRLPDEYAILWTDSLFTSKPIDEPAPPPQKWSP